MKNNSTAFAILSTDVAVLTSDGEELKVLLTKAESPDFKEMPTLPGGLVRVSETTDQAVVRILKDVVTKTDFYRQQLFTFDDPKRDPSGRVVSVAYLMVVPWNEAKLIIKKNASWEAVNNLSPLAYDHNEVVDMAVRRLRGRMTYTNIVINLMSDEFTLSDLQKIYESVLKTKLDKRNFIKKIKSLKLLKKTGKKIQGGAHRPATLYRFTDREYKLVDLF